MTELSDEERKNYLKAGEIAEQVRAEARRVAKPGARLLDVAEKLEAKTKELGGSLAFPLNLSLNDTAAHYTPVPGDGLALGPEDVLKVDLGVAVEGCVCDTALTLDFGGRGAKLVDAVEAALDAALSLAKPGVAVGELGAAIEREIRARGVRPIVNLCGHRLLPYTVHGGQELPNVGRGGYKFEEGDVFACEPFATDGRGMVKEAPQVEIFMLQTVKPVRLPQSRSLLRHVEKEFQTLPFARRWVAGLPGAGLALQDLVKQGVLYEYHVLKEEGAGLVAQAETSFIVEADGIRPLARAQR
jgi:methionyl aminopeptidase